MTTPTELEDFFRVALSLGASPEEISRARRDPAQCAQLFSRISRLCASRPMTHGEGAEYKSPEDLAESFMTQFDVAKAAAAAEQTRPLRFPPAANRLESIAATERMRSTMQLNGGDDAHVLWSFMGVPKHSSNTPLDQLKPIRLKEMQVTQAHKGRYLLCRIVSVPTRLVGVTFIVEDQDGRVEHLSLYNLNLPDLSAGPDLDALFPRGAVLAVREPTYKPNQNGTCHVVRIDSPTDYEILAPSHPLVAGARWATAAPVRPLPASFDFKALGNKYFAEKKDVQAVKAYGDGLAATDDAAKRLVLFLNRAQAHLRLGNFASAYRDTSAVLGFLDVGVCGPPLAEIKAALRRAKALEGMRQLTRAGEAYARVLALDEASVEGMEGAQRIVKMLRESRTGEYDWRELALWEEEKDAKEGPAVGDFVGPVEVVEREGRGGGRGIVATRDIKAGEILLVEKAFATGYNETKRLLGLVASLVAKIQDDPSTAALLYALHGGPDSPPIGSAALGALQDRPLAADDVAPFADITRVENVCIVNSFGLTMPEEATPTALQRDSSGFFLGSSLFNHSCCPNAQWRCFGDVQVIRACAPIKRGEECFIAYIPAEAPQKTRDGVLKVHFPAGCSCTYCADVRLDKAADLKLRDELVGPSSRYIAIRDAINGARVTSLASIRPQQRTLKGIVDQLEATYSPRRGPLRPELVQPLHVLADFSYPGTDADRARGNDLDRKSIAASGAVLRDSPGRDRVEVVDAPLVAIAQVERTLLKIAWRSAMRGSARDDREAKRWIRAAAEMARVLHGVDFDGFVERAAEDLTRFGLDRLVPACGP
ncbi:hypothetical protein JCM10449v2_000377 [Rhodotorula kratochvilovae]